MTYDLNSLKGVILRIIQGLRFRVWSRHRMFVGVGHTHGCRICSGDPAKLAWRIWLSGILFARVDLQVQSKERHRSRRDVGLLPRLCDANAP